MPEFEFDGEEYETKYFINRLSINSLSLINAINNDWSNITKQSKIETIATEECKYALLTREEDSLPKLYLMQ